MDYLRHLTEDTDYWMFMKYSIFPKHLNMTGIRVKRDYSGATWTRF